jgi:hypothetical protein
VHCAHNLLDLLCTSSVQHRMGAWLLTFYVLHGMPFIGGEYQTEDRCRTAAAVQMVWWQKQYGRRISWKCTQERM